jgi:hypothetical protein
MYVVQFPVANGNRVDVRSDGKVLKYISHEGDLGESEARDITGTQLGSAYWKKALLRVSSLVSFPPEVR